MSNINNEGLRQATVRVQTSRRLNPGELEEIEAFAQRGYASGPEEVLALVNTIGALSRRIAVRFNQTAQARQDAAAAREKAEEFRRSRDYVERAWSNAIREIHDLRERLRSAETVLEARGPMADLGYLAIREIHDLRERLRSAETVLEARGPMADLGHLADAVTRAEQAERRVQELEGVLDQFHGEHVPGDEADLRRILVERQQRIEELEAEVRIEELEAEVRIEELEAEVARRYTADQVGELQTSEAELVSAPLKKRIAQLEQELDDRLQSLEQVRKKREAAERYYAEANTRASMLQVAVDDWITAGRKIADLVWGEGVDRATAFLEDQDAEQLPEGDITAEQGAGRHLVQVIHGVREAMPRLALETDT